MAEPLPQHSPFFRHPRGGVLAWPSPDAGALHPSEDMAVHPNSDLESPAGGSHNSPAHTSSRPALEVVQNLLTQPLPGTLRPARQLSGPSVPRAETLMPTAEPAFDTLLGGGLARGSLVELVGRRSCGRFALVLSTLAAATGTGEPAVLIDLGDHLDPQLAQDAGVTLSRLLWLRPRHVKQVLLGAEMVLATGFPLVVVDLGMPPVPGGRGAEASWLRLARAARNRNAALLVSTPYRVSGTAATSVLEASKQHCRWRGRGMAPRLLRELGSRLRVDKLRGRAPGAQSELYWVPGQLATPFERPDVEFPFTASSPAHDGSAYGGSEPGKPESPLPFQYSTPHAHEDDSSLAIAAGG